MTKIGWLLIPLCLSVLFPRPLFLRFGIFRIPVRFCARTCVAAPQHCLLIAAISGTLFYFSAPPSGLLHNHEDLIVDYELIVIMRTPRTFLFRFLTILLWFLLLLLAMDNHFERMSFIHFSSSFEKACRGKWEKALETKSGTTTLSGRQT